MHKHLVASRAPRQKIALPRFDQFRCHSSRLLYHSAGSRTITASHSCPGPRSNGTAAAVVPHMPWAAWITLHGTPASSDSAAEMSNRLASHTPHPRMPPHRHSAIVSRVVRIAHRRFRSSISSLSCHAAGPGMGGYFNSSVTGFNASTATCRMKSRSPFDPNAAP